MDRQEKTFPINYPHDVLRIIDAMSFDKGRNVRVMGSMALRSQAYAADYDCYEVVNRDAEEEEDALKTLAKEFKQIVKKIHQVPTCFITDIKAGSVEEWRVIPDNAYIKGNKILNLDIPACRNKIEQLEKDGILSHETADSYLEKLNLRLTPAQFVIIKKDIRPNIVRWNAAEIEKGYKVLVDKRKFTLEQAFSTPVITKLDLIGWVQGFRFAEFSMIYKFVNKGKALNRHTDDVELALKESILYYSLQDQWFKVAKRMYSYARFHDDESMLRKLTPFLNSDIGRLYVILSDINTILLLLDQNAKVPKTKLYFALDQIRGRFSNVYTLPSFIKLEFKLIMLLESALNNLKEDNVENLGLAQDLNAMANTLSNIINNQAEFEMGKLGLFPIPKKFVL